jgi:hypothetical protein
MTTPLPLDGQRTAIHTAISVVYTHPVHKYPAEGKISPPCVTIGKPTIAFDTPSVGLVMWDINIYETRSDVGATAKNLETALQAILLELRKGANCNLVLQNVFPLEADMSGYTIPAYTINATSTLSNC